MCSDHFIGEILRVESDVVGVHSARDFFAHRLKEGFHKVFKLLVGYEEIRKVELEFAFAEV